MIRKPFPYSWGQPDEARCLNWHYVCARAHRSWPRNLSTRSGPAYQRGRVRVVRQTMSGCRNPEQYHLYSSHRWACSYLQMMSRNLLAIQQKTILHTSCNTILVNTIRDYTHGNDFSPEFSFLLSISAFPDKNRLKGCIFY